MKITLPLLVWLLWFVVVLQALGAIGWHACRGNWRRVQRAVVAMGGALLLFGWVSAVIGFYELEDFAGSGQCWVLLAVGGVGLAGFVWGNRAGRAGSPGAVHEK